MTCREFIDFLWKYLDEELEPGERTTFDEHLAVCPDCVAYLDSYRRTVALGRDALACGKPEEPVPEDVPEDLVTAILAARGDRKG
jgi:anti-sigma factor RsiW